MGSSNADMGLSGGGIAKPAKPGGGIGHAVAAIADVPTAAVGGNVEQSTSDLRALNQPDSFGELQYQISQYQIIRKH